MADTAAWRLILACRAEGVSFLADDVQHIFEKHLADAEQRGLERGRREGMRWIRCSPATLPTVGDRVLCLSTCNDPMVLDYAGAGDFTDLEDDQVTFAVSHWRPLPASPEAEPVKGGEG